MTQMTLDHISVVGLGSIGRRHLRLLRKIRPNVEITLVRSGQGRGADEVELADRVVDSIDRAVQKGIQGAIVSSPASMHVDHVTRLLKAGVHVLVEKPLSDSFVNGATLIAEQGQGNVTCLLGYMLRYEKAAVRLKDLIQEDRVGRLLHVRVECGSYLPDWRPNFPYQQSVSALAELGGGALLELSHELDYLIWFFGDVIDIYAQINNSAVFNIQVEDSVDAIITPYGGFPISLHLDFNRRTPKRICTVYGENGEISWNAIEKTIEIKIKNDKCLMESYPASVDQAYVEQLHHFFNCVEKGDSPKIGIREGLEVLKVIDAARISSRDGIRVAIN